MKEILDFLNNATFDTWFWITVASYCVYEGIIQIIREIKK